MPCGNNYIVQQVLQRLRTDQFDDSCDEDKETDVQDEDLIPIVILESKVLTMIKTVVKMSKTQLFLLYNLTHL